MFINCNLIVILLILLFSSVWSQFYLHLPEIPENHGICKNWIDSMNKTINNNNNNNNDQQQRKCTMKKNSLHCFGWIPNLNELRQFNNDTTTIYNDNIQELLFCGFPNLSLNADLLKIFPKLKILRIEHSNMTHINNDFPPHQYLESINISWTQLRYTRPKLFEKLYRLKYLDLRWNKLDKMDGPLILPQTFISLNLTGNPWNCSQNLKWLLNTDVRPHHITDSEELLCTDIKYLGRHLLTVMQYRINLQQECQNIELNNCTCKIIYIHPSDDGNYLIPIYSVSCIKLQLNHLPSFLPENTTILHVEENMITNLDPMITNEVYRHVKDIYLDNNLIKSIDVLEDSDWLENFRVFSLKGNKLKKIPVYLLRNSFKKNHNIANLYLSDNPWRCDCLFVPKFQEFIMEYNHLIKDTINVTCKYIDGHIKQLNKQILSIKVSDVCHIKNDNLINPLDILNCVLAFLIIFILGKLVYDYYRYRRYGKLPWIVIKMP